MGRIFFNEQMEEYMCFYCEETWPAGNEGSVARSKHVQQVHKGKPKLKDAWDSLPEDSVWKNKKEKKSVKRNYSGEKTEPKESNQTDQNIIASLVPNFV